MTTQDPIAGRAVFFPALMSHMWAFAISVSAISVGWSVTIDWLSNGLEAFGWSSAILFLLILAHEFDAQKRLLKSHLMRHDAITESLRPQVASPVVASSTRVPFPPVSFVRFIFDWFDVHGRFPTVAQCLENKQPRAQEYYTQMVAAHAMSNRVPGQWAGDPAWDRDRCLRAAMADNSDDALRDAFARQSPPLPSTSQSPTLEA